MKTFQSFKVAGYRTYFGSMTGNWFAMSMNMMVRSLLIYRLTGSATIVGVLSLASALPTLLVSLIGGAVADRLPKKYILFFGRLGSATLTLGIAFALTSGYLSPAHQGSWWLLILTTVFEGVFNGFINPANMSIIPEIAGRENVMNAISLSMAGQNIFKLAGPALAGYLIDAYDFSSVYFLMTGLYVLSSTLILFLPRTGNRTVHSGNPLSDAIQGMRYIGSETAIMLIVIFAICHVISGQPFTQMLPVFTESVLKISASKLGTLVSISSIGSLVGSFVLASLPNKKRGIMLLLSGLIMGVPIIIFSFFHQWYLLLLLMPFIGLGPTMHGALTATLVQSYADPNYRARMQGFVTMASGLANLGTFVAGVLADAVGVQWAVSGMALCLVLASTAFLVFAPKLRKLD